MEKQSLGLVEQNQLSASRSTGFVIKATILKLIRCGLDTNNP